MPDQKPVSSMGDIIGSTRERLEQAEDNTSRLKDLVAATSISRAPAGPTAPRDTDSGTLPPNYFPQHPAELAIVPKRKPKRGPVRSLHISMRMSIPERDRLVKWCEARNLSLPDGLMALLDLAEGKENTDE